MKIHKLTLDTNRLDALKKFYGHVMGLTITNESDSAFSLLLQQTELVFQQHTGKDEPIYHFAINIPANKIEEANTWLADKTALLFLEDYNSYIADFKNWQAKSVYFFDPAGSIVELIARFDLDNATDAPFCAAQWLNISETGLVFPPGELEVKTQQLLADYKLSYFSKQPPMDHFKAVGDDEGLFIIVPEHRAWYPTQDRLAVISPMEISFSNGSKNHSLIVSV